MDIKRVTVRHFRGIKTLDWDVGGRFVCLVGPGDSTKTTILDAINLALTPRRNVVFDDSDFCNADTGTQILIEVTVGGVPAELLALGKFGSLVRGWSGVTGLRDEPADDDEPVLTVALSVDAALEPTWLVVNNRDPEGKRISAFERARFGVSRIGSYVDWQLSWGQGSALTRLMEEKEDVHLVLAEARRKVRASLDPEAVPLLKKSAETATRVGKPLGVVPSSEQGFVPNLDVRGLNLGTGILALHDGPVPVRQAGLGTSRLLTTALQHEASRAGGITLIDEIEHGLEPHRVRRLLQVLRTGQRLDGAARQVTAPGAGSVPSDRNQVFLTTHSAVALVELDPAHLRIVRCEHGTTVLRPPNPAIRPLLRTNPEAFLARKVIVCEGKTEIGLCRALDRWWSSAERSFAYSGVALADGGGNTNGPTAALSFAELGYRTVFFGDSDEPPTPSAEDLGKAGVCAVLWPGGLCTEERVALDLPWDGFVAMVRQAFEEHGDDHVQAKLAEPMGRPAKEVPVDPEKWVELLSSEVAARSAFARAAKARKAEWFKRVDQAERLGEIIIQHWLQVAKTPLGAGIKELEGWVYD